VRRAGAVARRMMVDLESKQMGAQTKEGRQMENGESSSLGKPPASPLAFNRRDTLKEKLETKGCLRFGQYRTAPSIPRQLKERTAPVLKECITLKTPQTEVT